MTKHIYYSSGDFANDTQVWRIRPEDADAFEAWIERQANGCGPQHYYKRLERITARQARSICATNRTTERKHKRNGAYDQNFGSLEPKIWDRELKLAYYE